MGGCPSQEAPNGGRLQKSSTFVVHSSWLCRGLVLMKNRCTFLLAQTMAKDYFPQNADMLLFIHGEAGPPFVACVFVRGVCAPLEEASVVGPSLMWLTCCQTHPCIACEEERHSGELCSCSLCTWLTQPSAAEGHLQSASATQMCPMKQAD